MSFLKSRRAPTFAEHADALRSALIEVAENSFFAFAVPTDPEQFADLVRNPVSLDPEQPPAPARWLSSTVRFKGAFAGSVEVVTSEPLARQLLSAFCGFGPEEELLPAQVTDSAGEFGNQVCGTWLTRACQRRRYDLEPPRVEWRPADWVPLDAAPDTPHDGDVLVCLNDSPVRLRVHFDADSL
jgi:Chemotaxis phosphatase CheX